MENLKKILYDACLKAVIQMGPDKIKEMSWFGKNHK